MKQPEPKTDLDALDACHDLEYLLLGNLRRLLEGPTTSQTRHALLVILNGLCDNLLRQVELKSAGGYMCDVLEEFPNWHRRVESLRCEAVASHSSLERLREVISRKRPFAAIAYEMFCDLRHWMQSLAAHREGETRLLQIACNLDVGGEA